MHHPDMQLKDYAAHRCRLQVESESCLPKLSPQTSNFTRAMYNLRTWLIVSKTNKRTTQFFRSTSAIIYEKKRQIHTVPVYVIHPFSKISICVELVMFFLWTFGYVVDPLILAFRPPRYSQQSTLETFVLINNVLQLIHVALCFILGYQVSKTKEIILKPKKIVRHYVRTYFFFDLFGSLPLRAMCNFLHLEMPDLYYQILHGTHLLRLVRLFTTLHYGRQLTLMLKISDSIHIILRTAYITFFILHWWTCVVYFLHAMTSYAYEVGEESWIIAAGIGFKDPVYWLRKYLICFNKVLGLFYGAGVGTYMSKKPDESLCSAVIAISGSIYYAYCLVISIQLARSLNASGTQYEVYLCRMHDFLRAKKLPKELRYRIIMYYEHKFQMKYFREYALLSTLSDHLRLEIFLQTCKYLIEHVAFFGRLPKSVVGMILACLKQEIYFPNDVILKVGSEENAMYFISYGTVAIYDIEGRECDHLSDGEHFGSLNLVRQPEETYIYNVVAIEMTECYRWERSDYQKCIAAHPELSEMIKSLIRKYSSVEGSKDFISESAHADVIRELRRGRIIETGARRRAM